jgi:N-dimethylarginine dimethylaminohydrolase
MDVLMAEPTYFDVRYSINPITNTGVPVRPAKAREQWTRLRARLVEAGVSVGVVPAPAEAEGLPDYVFVKNAALFVNTNTAILARFAHSERRGEEAVVGDWLRRHGVTVIELPEREGLYFEGAGDAAWSDDSSGRSHLWIAYGAGRTMRAGAEAVRSIVRELTPSVSVHLLRLAPGSAAYHLDLGFRPIGPRSVLVQHGAFVPAAIQEIERVFGVTGVVRVPSRYFYACNSVVVGDGGVIVTPKLAVEGYRSWLTRKTGLRVVEVNVSEFQKAGGSVACMVLPLVTR